MPKPTLVASIDTLAASPFVGRAFRHQAEKYDPLSGRGARIHGGRWNPKDSFSVLYLALDEATVALEFRRLAAKQGLAVTDFLPRTLYGYDLVLSSLLDLRSAEALESVGLGRADVQADDLRACQEVGVAAQHAGREGVLAPAAVGRGSIAAVFLDSIGPSSSIEPRALGTWEVPGDLDS